MHQYGSPIHGRFEWLFKSYGSKVIPAGSLDAEKIAEAVLSFVYLSALYNITIYIPIRQYYNINIWTEATKGCRGSCPQKNYF